MNKTLITFFTLLFCLTSSVGWSEILLLKCLFGKENILFKVENQLINKKVSYREKGYWKPYCENNKHYNLTINEDSFICNIKSHKTKTLYGSDGQTFTPILAGRQIIVDLITYSYTSESTLTNSRTKYVCLDYKKLQ